MVENPEDVYNRETQFRKYKEYGYGEEIWHTDFSAGEYGDIRLDFCPFCGKKL